MGGSGSKITPCIWLDDQAEQAAAFYVRTFPAGRIVATSRYPESGDKMEKLDIAALQGAYQGSNTKGA